MKKILVLFLFLVFPIVSFSNNIAIVNSQDIVENSIAIINTKKKLDAEKANYQNKFSEQEKILNKRKMEIETEKSRLEEDIKARKISENDIETKMASLQERVYKFQNDLVNFQNEVRSTEDKLNSTMMSVINFISNEVKNITTNLMKEEKYNKYDYVLTSDVVIFYKQENDITAEVLKRLNKSVKNIDLNKIKLN